MDQVGNESDMSTTKPLPPPILAVIGSLLKEEDEETCHAWQHHVMSFIDFTEKRFVMELVLKSREWRAEAAARYRDQIRVTRQGGVPKHNRVPAPRPQQP